MSETVYGRRRREPYPFRHAYALARKGEHRRHEMGKAVGADARHRELDFDRPACSKSGPTDPTVIEDPMNPIADAARRGYARNDGSLRGSKGNTVQARTPRPWLPPQL